MTIPSLRVERSRWASPRFETALYLFLAKPVEQKARCALWLGPRERGNPFWAMDWDALGPLAASCKEVGAKSSTPSPQAWSGCVSLPQLLEGPSPVTGAGSWACSHCFALGCDTFGHGCHAA